MKRWLFVELRAARERKRQVGLVTDTIAGTQALVGLDPADELLGDLTLEPAKLEQARLAIAEDRTGKLADGRTFVQVFASPYRMIVIGAVHIAQALLPMARAAGYAVTLVDPRQAWATEERFPDIKVLTDWPDDAMKLIKPDRRSAIVVLTHDPKLDDPALTEALASDAFYVGALGSRKTHAKRLERLRESGLDEAALDRIHAPIGLAIGAKSPAEIAISILAEITQARRAPPPSQSGTDQSGTEAAA